MNTNNLYYVQVRPKNNGCGLLTSELNKLALTGIYKQCQFNLCYFDVLKLKKRAAKVCKDTELIVSYQESRSEQILTYKKMYPGYTIRDLNSIGVYF